jgi:hypothetical protein
MLGIAITSDDGLTSEIMVRILLTGPTGPRSTHLYGGGGCPLARRIMPGNQPP